MRSRRTTKRRRRWISKGRTLIPGFTDTHVHPMSLSPRAIEPTKANSIVEIQAQLRAKAKELGPGQWITGYSWDEALLTEKRNITSKDLDVATPNNPVVLTRAGSHSSVGNSLAMKAAGITRTTGGSEIGDDRTLRGWRAQRHRSRRHPRRIQRQSPARRQRCIQPASPASSMANKNSGQAHQPACHKHEHRTERFLHWRYRSTPSRDLANEAAA